MDTATNLNKNNDAKKENWYFLNPKDFEGIQPVVKAGCIYPDLYSQASYLNKDIKNLNDRLLEAIEELTSWERYGSVERILDALYNHILQEAEASKDRDEVTSRDINDIANDTFCYNQLAKGLLNILLITDCIKEKKESMEFTKHRILL